YTWLRKHNPEINFETQKVSMTRCSPRCCTGCRSKVKEEAQVKKIEKRIINACRSGPLPAFVEDADDEED
ncbi:hypothetical protein CPC08DRAFT_594304, partial [Agrocybe pediades]